MEPSFPGYRGCAGRVDGIILEQLEFFRLITWPREDSKQPKDKDEMEILLDEFEKQVYGGKMHLWIWRDLGKSLGNDPDP